MSGKIINAPLFPNQDWGRDVCKHNRFPVYVTDEFDFLDVLNSTHHFMAKVYLI